MNKMPKKAIQDINQRDTKVIFWHYDTEKNASDFIGILNGEA